MKSVVIAAPHSGSGKTTVTLGIMAALRRRGLLVAPFKVGPDFIDPGYHALATGRISVNLDGWMCGRDFVRSTFARHTEGADIAVVEGVMGLFDGMDGVSDAGSSAEVAKLLDAPVVLVVDARSQARSAAALVHGFAFFDPELRVAGVIFNNVGSDNHERLLRDAMAASLPDIAVVGCLPRDPELAIPSRHLGLTTADDNPLSPGFLAHLVEVAERYIDLDFLVGRRGIQGKSPLSPFSQGGGRGTSSTVEGPRGSFAIIPPPLEGGGEGVGEAGKKEGVCCATVLARPYAPAGAAAEPVGTVIAVARDAAFCFVYEDNLRLLRESGAELRFFSPLAGDDLPAGVGGIYLPGGYPELFAGELGRNAALMESVRQAVAAGMPVYAECGGFIYLTRGVRSGDGFHPLAGVFPVETRMLPRRKALGYREVELMAATTLGGKGAIARGHEFHYSEMEEMPPSVERVYTVKRRGVVIGTEGYRIGNCLASYIHLHFGGSPAMASSFVGHCRAYRERSVL
ncbi:cobyrinate a,c-diamide synthase [Geomonas sp. Red32]|uniref:cobyrinate a,c-diamide synthase n=1 Tax=Geomonas sp. Red32 TaxID=2912856 RepID=UPI00202CA761|nr:cobyrinate a,c-diamide synthase [Geomonas sp. Red32]MCM0081084.1 cobyrinate a,c-diamide synthase [Geomonas sp. Red32]